jgi:translation elongation factor aEF-1 beta
MGDVAITFRMMPMSRDSNIEDIKKDITRGISSIQSAKLKQIVEKPIAFGLNALDVLIIVPDSVGPSKIEEALRRVKNVASVETESVTLL